jgi:hypothetical protein
LPSVLVGERRRVALAEAGRVIVIIVFQPSARPGTGNTSELWIKHIVHGQDSTNLPMTAARYPTTPP